MVEFIQSFKQLPVLDTTYFTNENDFQYPLC